MTLTNNVVAKFAVAFVAVAMMFSAIAPVASAQNVSDMSLEELIAMVTALQSQLGQSGTTGGSTTTGTSYTFTRDLTLGSEGADVTALQNWLIAQGQTIPAGATGYFGAQTQSALAAWQAANGISPAAGYFGPITRAAVAAVAPVDEDEDDEDDDNGGPMTLSGEGELTTFEISDEEDEVGEGASETVAMLTLEAEDGDVELSRLTLRLDANNANEETDPWDSFDMVELMLDGDVIAEFDASDEDEYLNEDNGTFRFSGMDLVLEEDTEVELEVVVTAANAVDGSDADAAEWDLTFTDVRYFDADGVATDADDIDELDDAVVVTFDITEEGSDDDASIESSSNDPDAATLRVEDDNSESDEYTVFAFEIEVDEDSSDLVLGDAVVELTVANPAGGVDPFSMDDVIADVYLTVDGEKIKGDEGAGYTAAIANSADQTVSFTFEFDEDVELSADEVYEAELSVVFEGRDSDTPVFDIGTTIVADVDGTTWELEGLEGDNVLTGTETSEIHTLAEVVPVISDVSSETDRNEDGTAGTISFEFTIEADGDDDYDFNVADKADVDGSTDDVRFTTTGGSAVTLASITKVSGDATADGSGWIINDGDEATFVLDVTFTTAAAADNGTYRVVLDTIGGVEIDETSAGMSLTNPN